MKRIIYILCIVVFPLCVFSQQWLQFTQQSSYALYLNPALSGAESKMEAALAHRSQYVGIENKTISSQYLGFSMPIATPSFGGGLSVINDIIGYQRYTMVEMKGAYHIYKGKSRFSVGLGFGLVNLSIDGTKLRATTGDYLGGVVIHNDESIPNEKIGNVNITSSIGVDYRIDGFSTGVAIQNINSPKISLSSSQFETNAYIGRTISGYGRYVIDMKKVNVIPFIMYKTDFAEHQLSTSVIVQLEKVHFGVGYRGFSKHSNDAVEGLFGFKIKEKIEVGYSYDYNLSFLNGFNTGSHEIGLRYILPMTFNKKEKGNVWHNSRFL